VINDDEGNTSGLKDRLRGHIGVSTRALRDGWTIGPPADSEYAVEPVGVDTMRPSDYFSNETKVLGLHKNVRTTASVRCWPSTYISIVLR
jgi:hypothetical protein